MYPDKVELNLYNCKLQLDQVESFPELNKIKSYENQLVLSENSSYWVRLTL